MTLAPTGGPLARIEEARRLLAQATTVDEVKEIRDMAEAVRVYARERQLGLDVQNHAAEIRLRAERRAGELLAAMPKNDGHRFSGGNTVLPPAATLADLGVDKMQSSRWQAVARVPAPAFDAYVAARKQHGQEITTADVLRLAPKRADCAGGADGADLPAVVTLTGWHAMPPRDRLRLIAEAPLGSRNGMTLHADTEARDDAPAGAIEWALWSRNVVTGCEHDCPYCYARDIAQRFYEGYGFEPAFHPDRLHSPRNVRVPDQAARSVGHRNIFCDSMADLFGKWVPQEWIDAELAVARACPQWNFLYLTKFPQRLAEQDWPGNAWCGTSVDRQARVATAERSFKGVQAGKRWLSCEPLLERLTFSSLAMFDWVVIGGATASTRTPVFRPPKEWIDHLRRQAEDAGCKVYVKANAHYVREYPEDGR